jgi:DNA-binding NtrC family response regulator
MSRTIRATAMLDQEKAQTLEAGTMALRHRILVVDDEDGMRSFLFTILARAGYDVVTAESVQVGSSALEGASADLLITDVRLGEFNGLQLLARNPRAVPAIVITGFPDPVLEAQAREFGAAFLLKPIEPAGLLTLVAELLAEASVKQLSMSGLGHAGGRSVATEKKTPG